jgi:hypothetical protein
MQDAIGYFPARLLQPVEHTVVAEWLANAGDVAGAYASNRLGDDPAHYRRIVIVTKPGDGPSHLIHAPARLSIWVLCSLGRETEFRTFPSLHAALNFVRPVLKVARRNAPRRKKSLNKSLTSDKMASC